MASELVSTKNSDRDWACLFLEQERSGQTVSAFCSAQGLNYHSFKNRKTYWKKHRELKGGVESKFIEVVPENKALVRVCLRNGRILEVPSNFQEANVRRLIGLLESC